MLMAGKHYLKKQNRSLGVPVKDVVECAVQSLGLNDVTKFDPNEKIIDYAVKKEDRPLKSLVEAEFVEELSTNSPAPGGGSVSALAGSLGASLSSMVAALTHEKKEMLDSKPLMDEIGVEAQALKDRLAFLVDEDTEAFNQVMEANRLPATDDTEKKAKEKAVDAANKYAIAIPMETAEKCYRVIELADTLVEKGNPNSVSDAGVAAEMALAGVRGACMNVLINLPGIQDQTYRDEKRSAVEDLIQKAESLHQAVYGKTIKVIHD
jgi:glutamate formiminotransferase/formiminotetrahydrofolate cyclodeaminase